MQTFDRLFGSSPRIHLTIISLAVIIYFLRIQNPWTVLFRDEGSQLSLAVIAGACWLVLGLWSARSLGRKIGLAVLSAGPYKYVRHPMYTAEIVFGWIIIGFILNTWLAAVGFVITLYLATHLVEYEEQMMERNFGDAWKNYARITPRFFPWMISHRQDHLQ
jgi:protein-S-isoprenylcysteine O-methyltransferase Ste14